MKSFTFFFALFFSFSIYAQNDKIVPLEELDQKPLFSGCEESKDPNCSKVAFAEYIQKNFDKELLSYSVNEIILDYKFILDLNGNVKWHSVRTEYDSFKNEAGKLIKSLPLYTPGSKDGNTVNVIMRCVVKVINPSERLGITEVDTPPLNKDCIGEDNPRECFSYWISNYINSNFNFKNVRKHVKKGYTYRNVVDFVVDNEGNFTEVEVSAPNEVIEAELLRLMASLPSVKPAEVKNKAVAIKFKLPVVFGLAK